MSGINVFIDDRVFNMFLCISTRSRSHVSKWVGINTSCCQKGRVFSCLSSFTTSAGFLFRLVFDLSGVTNTHSLAESQSVLFCSSSCSK